MYILLSSCIYEQRDFTFKYTGKPFFNIIFNTPLVGEKTVLRNEAKEEKSMQTKS